MLFRSGFGGMEYDTLARHGVNVVGVMGNNGIWALEKHPMEFLYGYSVAAELTPGTRYDKLVEALGGVVVGLGFLIELTTLGGRDRLGERHKVFDEHRPEIVFHAAALKHLPMLERFPDEGWKTNVLGTLNLLRLAEKHQVAHFVNISTDKAADATSVLGTTKRIAEQLTAWHAERSPGHFISVRFGNVLGSRGSMLHTFNTQIEAGGPVTVTHPDVTRYFMTIPEACELVVQAGTMGRSGDVMVLEMGEPVKILDVARRMIELSHATGVEIVFTGLRPGEKLHEKLFSDEEQAAGTEHQMIRSVAVPPVDPAELSDLVQAMGDR